MKQMNLSPIQEQFWLLYNLNPDDSAYNIFSVFRINLVPDIDLLEKAVKIILNRHEILRSSILQSDSKALQVIHSEDEFDFKIPSIKINTDSAQNVIPKEVVGEVNLPFDLSTPPLFRIKLFTLTDHTSVLTIVFHHIIIDTRSEGLFSNELSAVYNDLSAGKNPRLKPVQFQYSKYIEYMGSFYDSDKNKQKLADWILEYSDSLERISLPSDFSQPPEYYPEGKGDFYTIDGKLYSGIKNFEKKTQFNSFRILLASYITLLHRLTNQETIIVGVPLTNRVQDFTKETMGCFVNTLPIKIDFTGNPTCIQILEQVNNALNLNLDRQEIPLLDLVNRVKVNRSSSNSFFQAGFTFKPQMQLNFKGMEIVPLEIVRKGSQLDLFFTIWEKDSGFSGYAEYNTQLFTDITMKRWVEVYKSLINEFISQPEKTVRKINILPHPDIQKIQEWNTTDAPYENQVCIHQKLEQQVLLTPDRLALICEEKNFTYQEFNQHVNRLANFLIAQGIHIESKVAVCIKRSPELMIAIYAILKAGGAYLPVDPDSPRDRIRDILEDAQPELILTTSESSLNLPSDKDHKILLDNLLTNPLSDNDDNPDTNINSRNLAYIIYTSGSTGKPKGVLIEHHSVLNRIGWMQKEYPLNDSDILIQKTPVTFDVSVWELFWWAFTGSGLVVLPKGAEKEPETLIDCIEKNKVTVIHFVPSMFGAFLNHLDAFELHEKITSLRKIFLSGEALPAKMVTDFYSLVGNDTKTEMINLYGPTEATVDVSHYHCSNTIDNETVYIGKPIDNTKLIVINDQNTIQPIGVPGELVIAGVNLSRGYLNRDELNKEKFVSIDYLDGTKIRAYRTGDLAKWCENGNIYYIGRIDNQVKIRGYRIELGDIESKLLEIPSVNSCAVIVNRSNAENPQLAAYLSLKKGSKVSAQDLKKILIEKLPEYMVPAHYQFLDQMPLTSSGKINRKALPDIDYAEQNTVVQASGKTERLLAEVWKSVLKTDKIGIDSNFFDVGGSSVLVPSVVGKLKKEFNIEIKTLDLFKYPTIRSLASSISESDKTSIEIKEKKDRLSLNEDRYNQTNDIAIVGMAGRFPGARNIEELWDVLVEGKDTVSHFSDEELEEMEGFLEKFKDNPNYVRAKGIIDDIEYWDADFFGVTSYEAKNTDPQHRIWLETVWHAFENAGIDPYSYNGAIGVFAGTGLNTYLLNNILLDPASRSDYLCLRTLESFQKYLNNDPSFIATRTSYAFNLKGPAINVQTGCSTALVAVIQACSSLLNHESDVCLAGGVRIQTPQKTGYLYQEGAITSPDGHNRAFDEKSQGTVFSNGVGVVVLKRLEDAIKERDRIYSVIKGWAVNNDGNRKIGFAAPSIEGQEQVIEKAQDMAGMHPEQISYIETHGTATKLGDPIEFQALVNTFRKKTGKNQFCGIGTIKSNIGHLDVVAGIVGLIKIALSSYYKKIPPTLYCTKPNPLLDIENSPFYIANEIVEKKNDLPLIMGVSSFGVGGTNAHVVVQEYLHESLKKKSGNTPQLIPLSAKSESSLSKLEKNIVEYLNSTAGNIEDVAYTLQFGRTHMPFRSYVVAGPGKKIHIDEFKKGIPNEHQSKLVFSFPGGGAQFVGMGKELYENEPVFKEEIDKCFIIYKSVTGKDLKQMIFGDKGDAKAEKQLTEIEYTQPALFCIEYSLAKLYMHYGIRPDYLIGHSTGEYIAACLAGVFDPEAGLRIIIKRGELMQTMPPGNMMAVRAGEQQLTEINKGLFDISALNAPKASTISFKPEKAGEITALLEKKKIDFIELNTNKAFHSSDCDPFLNEFAAFVDSFKKNVPGLPVISSYTGAFLSNEEAVSGDYWARQSRGTVRFNHGIKVLTETGDMLFFEVGPSTHLSSMLLQNDNIVDKTTIVSSLGKPDDESEYINFFKSLGNLWIKGVKPAFDKFHTDNTACIVTLPAYPFERKRYWIDVVRKYSDTYSEEEQFDVSNVEKPVEEKIIESDDAEDLSNPIQSKLKTLWQEFLGTDNIGIRDNFFEMGGHSLLALQILSRVKEIFSIEISLKAFLSDPTIKYVEKIIRDTVTDIEHQVNYDDLIHNSEKGHLPLYSEQKRLWITAKLDRENPAYNIPTTYRFEGRVDYQLFQKSIELLFERHHIIFCVFNDIDGEPYCEVKRPANIEIQRTDISGLSRDEKTEKLTQIVADDSRQIFDLENGPLYRLMLIKTNKDEYYFHSTIHHLVFDGLSWEVLVKDLSQIYNSLLHGKEPNLDILEIQAYDYAFWQAKHDLQKNENELKDFWKKQLKDVSPLLNFPYDRPRTGPPTGHGSKVYLQVPEEDAMKLRKYGKSENSTLFMTMLSIFSMLIQRYSGESDFCIGTPVSNRPNSKLEKIFGMFVNTIVLRQQFDGIKTFKDLVNFTKKTVLDAIAHQDLPFEKIVESLQPERSLMYNPIFQIAFAWQNNAGSSIEFENATGKRVAMTDGISPFDITVYMWQNGDIIEAEIEYNISLLNRKTILQFKENFLRLIRNITDNFEAPIAEISLVTDENIKVLKDFSGHTGAYPRDVSIVQLFKEQVNLRPDEIAVQYKNRNLTYSELDKKSDQLAAQLSKMGVHPEDAIGLFCSKSLDLIVAMLSILKVSGAYLPLDPDYPVERINYMIRDAKCRIILTQKHLQNNPVECHKVLLIDDPDVYKTDASILSVSISATSLAYIMYTSGTTGKPKGSMIEHRSVIRLVRNTNYIELTEKDKILLTGAIGFDATTFEIWGALLNGGKLYIVDKEVILTPSKLGQELKENKITTLWLTSSLFTQIAEINSGIFKGLRSLLVGGDILSVEHINKVRHENPGLTVINGYGPTENTTFSTCHRIDKEYDGSIPIGKPISNSTAYIFDKYMNYCPVGIIGELYVGGDGLSRAYLNDKNLNKEKFIEHPYNPGERLFRTGDRARWLDDGAIEFHGRIDSQLKIMGFRVEPMEIEAVLNDMEGIIESVIKPVAVNKGVIQLYAFLNVPKNFSMKEEELIRILKEKLPVYMIPAGFCFMHGFPKNINGKIDRNELIVDSSFFEKKTTGNRESLSATEKKILPIFSSILKHDNFTSTDNFFDVGGSSLLALTLISRIEKQFGYTIAFRDFMAEYNTIKKLAELLDENTQSELKKQEKQMHQKGKFNHLYCIKQEGHLPPLFSIYGERALSGDSYLGSTRPIYAFVWPGTDAEDFVMDSVEEVAAAYLRQVKEINSEGPYYFIGFSFGGLVAMEMASQLQHEGYKVPLLALLDCIHPNENVRKLQKYKHLAKNHGIGYMLYDRLFRGAPRLIKRKTEELLVTVLSRSNQKLPAYLRRRKILLNSMKIYGKYKPGIYDGTLLLFKVKDNSIKDEYLGWGPHAKEVKAIMLEGVHLDAIDLPVNKEIVTKEITNYLGEVPALTDVRS
ncbi:MAG: amino acid adenylation domain-containing protein [Bacteroidales bacterium]|nr:amino acid adenylation domain-containing protein [Bacteroidales bacterium]